MTQELKPCPFCGSDDVRIAVTMHESWYYGECESCASRTGYLLSQTEAIDAWNTRAERTCENEVRAINAITPMEFRTDNFKCSACGELFFADGEGVNYPIDWAYCPNCGAKVVDA